MRPGAIQVQRRGVSRPPRLSEALALVLGALGTLNRSSGVRTINTEMNGQPVALAMIEGALFGEDTEGNTTLDEITMVNDDETKKSDLLSQLLHGSTGISI